MTEQIDLSPELFFEMTEDKQKKIFNSIIIGVSRLIVEIYVLRALVFAALIALAISVFWRG